MERYRPLILLALLPFAWSLRADGPAPADSSKEETAPAPEYEKVSTPSLRYHGKDYAGRRIVFCLDTSLSMQAGTRMYGGAVGRKKPDEGDPSAEPKSGPRRIDLAKEELIRAIRDLRPSQQFAVVFFDDAPQTWPEEKRVLQQASEQAKEQAVAVIQKRPLALGTDIYGALETALSFQKVDTVFLLTDGAPYTPRDREKSVPENILEMVKAKRNRRASSRVAIHALLFAQGVRGAGPAQGGGERAVQFMKDLAEANGGTFSEVDSGVVEEEQE